MGKLGFAALAVALLLLALAGPAGAAQHWRPAAGAVAHWRGHVVRVKLVGQIDAAPCPKTSCLRGVVATYLDGMDTRDRVVRCAWPRPRILDFQRYGHRAWVKVRLCGVKRWWRFR